MNLKETYNRIAEDWYKDHSQDDWWVEGTDKFVSMLESGGSVLDVGCGAGVKSKYLAEKGLKVVGIDISDKLLEIAKREVPQAIFKEIDMKEVETLGEQFDGVFAQASLLHIPRKEIIGTISKLLSVLKLKGYIYIAVKGVIDGKKEEILRENDYGYEYERFFSYYRIEELEDYCKELNLNIIYRDTHKHNKVEWLQIIGQKV